MKNLFLFLSFMILISCGKDDENVNIPGAGTLTMKINGVLWEGSILGNMVDEDTENAVLNSLNTKAGETFGFTIEDFKGVGDYPTSQGANFTGAFYGRKDKVVFSAGSELKYKVTTVEGAGTSKKIQGTFSGSVKSSTGEVLTITEGKF